MSNPVTMHIGPLGSTIHVLRADAATIAELAAIDWSRHFRRVCLDPARGLITLMSPSHLHEDLAGIHESVRVREEGPPCPASPQRQAASEAALARSVEDRLRTNDSFTALAAQLRRE